MSALNRFGRMYLTSMQENRPTMYREAEQAGKLEDLAVAAQTQAEQTVASLISEGVNPMEAQSQATQELLLPDEKQVPDLNQNPFLRP